MNETLHMVTIAAALLLMALVVALSFGPVLAEALTLLVIR